MRKYYAVMILLAGTVCGIARADAVVSGDVYVQLFDFSVQYPTTALCSESGSSYSSLSLSCGGDIFGGASASIYAGVGPIYGNVVGSVNPPGSLPSGFTNEYADFTLSVNGMYMLTGGTGYGYVDLFTSNSAGGGPSFYGTCSLTLDGQSVNCGGDLGPEDFLFYVPYK